MDSNLSEQLIEKQETPEDQVLSLKDTFLQSLYLGCISFGGPVAHIGLFRQYLIQEKKLISEKKFTALFTLSNILPGPTSSQLYTVISTLKSRSLLGGLISFIGFNIPSLLIVLLFTSLFYTSTTDFKYRKNESSFSGMNLLYVFSLGLAQGALGIVIQAGLTLGKKVADTYLQKVLLISAAMFYFLYNSYMNMLIIMILGGVISLLFVYFLEFDEENKSLDAFDYGSDMPEVNNTGITLLIVFALTFLILIGLSSFFHNLTLNLMVQFYKIGSLIFGGGHVVIPMIMSEFSSKGYLSEIDVINGFSLISMLPGPMFNIAGFVGTVINGVFAGFMSAVCIFAPGILLVLATFPFLNYVKSLRYVQIFLKGVSSASIGFIFSAALTLWLETCYYSKYSLWWIGTINVSICYTIIMLNYIAPIAIIFGGFFLTFFTLFGIN
jgi:chromate transporter